MARGLAGVLMVALALTASASAANTAIGTGTSAWGEPFSLSITQEKAGGTDAPTSDPLMTVQNAA